MEGQIGNPPPPSQEVLHEQKVAEEHNRASNQRVIKAHITLKRADEDVERMRKRASEAKFSSNLQSCWRAMSS